MQILLFKAAKKLTYVLFFCNKLSKTTAKPVLRWADCAICKQFKSGLETVLKRAKKIVKRSENYLTKKTRYIIIYKHCADKHGKFKGL